MEPLLIASLIANAVLAVAMWRTARRRGSQRTPGPAVQGGGGPGEEGPTK
jgi:hypothetical protein